MSYVFGLFEKRYLGIGVLSSFFGQNLDSDVVVLVRSVSVVIAVYLPIQDDRGRSRGERLAGHLQLFWRSGLETLGPSRGREASKQPQDQSHCKSRQRKGTTTAHSESAKQSSQQPKPFAQGEKVRLVPIETRSKPHRLT